MSPYSKTLALAAIAAVTALATTLGAARADEWQPLRDDARITSGLTVVAIGRHIHLVCPDISARPIRALAFVEGLVDHAQAMGFSRRQIEEYIDNDAEKDRYRAIATRYFAERGSGMDDVSGVCQVGRDEIAEESTIGRLLREG